MAVMSSRSHHQVTSTDEHITAKEAALRVRNRERANRYAGEQEVNEVNGVKGGDAQPAGLPWRKRVYRAVFGGGRSGPEVESGSMES